MTSERSFKSMQDDISTCLVETTRTAGQIANEDLAFLRSSDPKTTKLLDKQNARLLSLARKLTKNVTVGTDIPAPQMRNAEEVEDNWRNIVDVVDNLLEKTDACLDEFTGVIKRLSPSQRNTPTPGTAAPKARPAKAFRDQNMSKPQLLFNNVPSNDEITAFKPLLRLKPHAIVPLEESMNPILSEDGSKQYKHPYETEIIQFQCPSSTYEKSDPIPFLPFESTKATFVDTPEAVSAMLAELKTAKEIAIDLEHHDTHSYIGLVSLMQISTRDKDWVVDTLKPWREDLQVLNEVFADPKIIKVFHGAFMDVMWLQRDLGLYVVGLFDTYHASRSLGYPRNNLASLLSRFANFDAQKKYQMADWRIRPLPDEMFEYARSDTHFLLYVFDNMKNELIERSNVSRPEGDLISTVFEESKKEALQRYERPFYDVERGMGPNGWYNMLSRTPALFTKEQFAVFRAVHQWRDELARKEDESLHFIMSKNTVFSIAREMPMDMSALLGCSHPVSQALKRNSKQLLDVIRKAKASGQNGPDMKDFMATYPAAVRPITKKANPEASQLSKSPFDAQATQSLPDVQNVESVRSESSNFWGTTVNGVKRRRIDTGHTQPELRLALLLPQLTAEIFDSGDTPIKNHDEESTTQLEPGARAEHRYVKDRQPKENNVFTIKELGGPRKRKAAELQAEKDPEAKKEVDLEPGEAISDEDPMDTSTDAATLAAQAKAEQKAARKAQKKLEKAQRKREEVERRNGLNEEEAFDYANAPSVLHAKPERNGKGDGKKAADPYAKSLDAPKGMRKVRKEIEGKSITYRS